MATKNITKTKIDLIVETGKDGHYWGRIEDKGFMPTGQGKSIKALIQNVKDCIEDYQQHEGKNDAFWSKIDLNNLEFNLKYDLQAFFEVFDAIKISNIAKKAGLNESLVRQYATGSKFPSIEQVKKIEKAIHDLGKELQKVKIYV